MESRGSVTARESFPSVSLQYQKLLTSNEYSVRVWNVNDPFAFPFKRSSLFPPRHGQTYHPGMWRSQTQFDKFARMSMFSEGLSRQSPLFSVEMFAVSLLIGGGSCADELGFPDESSFLSSLEAGAVTFVE